MVVLHLHLHNPYFVKYRHCLLICPFICQPPQKAGIFYSFPCFSNKLEVFYFLNVISGLQCCKSKTVSFFNVFI